MKVRKCKCGKKAAKGRNECLACKQRKYREKYPLKTYYDNMKMNANRRGKEFTIDFDYFCSLIDDIEEFGRGMGFLTIDRINNNLGYIRGNLQILKFEENASKGSKELDEIFGVFEYECPY